MLPVVFDDVLKSRNITQAIKQRGRKQYKACINVIQANNNTTGDSN